MLSLPTLARCARSARPRSLVVPRSTRSFAGVVFSVVGPDRPGLLSDVSHVIAEAGGNVTTSSSFALGPIFSMAVLADVGADARATTTAAIQAAVPDHAVSAHPADEAVPHAAFSAEVEVSCADGVGLIAKVTDYIARAGLSLAKLETKSEGAPHGGATLFSLTGVMRSDKEIDEEKLADGFTDLENTMGIRIEYTKL